MFLHLSAYGDPGVRRAVPLALAMLSVSNPNQQTIVDTLSKLSHDQDIEVATNSIVSLGLVSAGTHLPSIFAAAAIMRRGSARVLWMLQELTTPELRPTYVRSPHSTPKSLECSLQ